MAQPPEWIVELTERALAEIHAVDLLSPIGCHYFWNKFGQQWEVTLFAARTEIVGGEYDGSQSASKFSVDLTALLAIFDRVHSFHWQALSQGEDDELGSHISLEGIYQDHNVWLRIPAMAPERFQTGRRANVYELRVEDTW